MQLACYRDGDMYLPVDVYRRGTQEVVLIGMIHVAPAEFYRRVRALLEGYDECGYRVLIEGMGRLDGDDFDLREFDRGLLEHYEQLRERASLLNGMMAGATGMVTQLDAFPDWVQWERADLSALEMMRLRGVRPLPPMDERVITAFAEFLAKPRARSAVYRFIRSTPRLLAALWPLHSMLGSLVLHHRNRHAVLKALETPQNAVLPWGAAHLPGMAKLLVQNGFARESRSWVLAYPGRDS
jgi:hypothetical protein